MYSLVHLQRSHVITNLSARLTPGRGRHAIFTCPHRFPSMARSAPQDKSIYDTITDPDITLAELQQRLDEAIDDENYSDAATLRDEIAFVFFAIFSLLNPKTTIHKLTLIPINLHKLL
jgi:hypothetical protein